MIRTSVTTKGARFRILSEIRMGKALRDGYRDRVFLMTKIDGRSKRSGEATDQSLCRLQIDMTDLVQHHEVLR